MIGTLIQAFPAIGFVPGLGSQLAPFAAAEAAQTTHLYFCQAPDLIHDRCQEEWHSGIPSRNPLFSQLGKLLSRARDICAPRLLKPNQPQNQVPKLEFPQLAKIEMGHGTKGRI